MCFSNLQNKYSKSLSWAWNLNKLFTVIGGKFKFQVQDSDLEYLFWQCEKHIALSEKKPPLGPTIFKIPQPNWQYCVYWKDYRTFQPRTTISTLWLKSLRFYKSRVEMWNMNFWNTSSCFLKVGLIFFQLKPSISTHSKPLMMPRMRLLKCFVWQHSVIKTKHLRSLVRGVVRGFELVEILGFRLKRTQV